MKSGFFIIYNGKMDREKGIYVRSRPSMPAPKREYEKIKVEGMDGELYEDKETYEDIEIDIEFNFLTEPEEWQEQFRTVKRWLYSKTDCRLIMSDDRGYYYNVKNVEIETAERVAKRIGKFTAKFICEGYAYKREGRNIENLGSKLLNKYEKTYPVYYIYGSGEVEINANGKTVKALVDEKLTIDTKLKLCYNGNKEIENTAMTGDYEYLALIEGENVFTYTDGFKVMIKPNWRSV